MWMLNFYQRYVSKKRKQGFMDLRHKNKLLYSRAGFGISIPQFDAPKPIHEAVNALFPQAAPGLL